MSPRKWTFCAAMIVAVAWYKPAHAQTGACCDDLSGSCTSGILQVNCSGPNQRFDSSNNCANFNPPCGQGACCLTLGAGCQLETQANCTSLGGIAWVGGEPCSISVCADCNGNLIADGLEIHQGGTEDCNDNGIPDSCDITSDPSIDCNLNSIPDSCDVLVAGADCNANGKPDECEIDVNSPAPGGPFFCTVGCDPDCNINGVPDACDIDPADPDGNGGTSPDCNHNNKPDECEIDINSPAPGGPWFCTGNCLEDCDDDGIPDVCEIPKNCSAPAGPFFCEGPGCNPDCNNNGIPDNCDIASGTSLDVNPADGVPDECRFWTGASPADDNWHNPANWQPPSVPNNVGPNHFSVVIESGATPVILNANATIDTLKMSNTMSLNVSGGNLTVVSLNGVVNEGTMNVSDLRSFIAGNSFSIKGEGKIDLKGDNAKIDSSAPANQMSSSIIVEGKGIIAGTFENTEDGAVRADDPTGRIVLEGTIENNGLIGAVTGGTLRIDTNVAIAGSGQSRIDTIGANVEIGDEDDPPRVVDGDGPVDVDPGSDSIFMVVNSLLNGFSSLLLGDNQIGPDKNVFANFLAGTSAMIAGPVVADQNAELTVDSSMITSASIELRDGSILTIANEGALVTAGPFINRGTDEVAFAWGSGTTLRLTGITSSCDVNLWPSKLEAAGTDFGPANPAGYNNNFDLSIIEVGPNASAVLFDQINNGNREGPFGVDEAVYADQFILGPNARLNLNGLRLYVAGNPVLPGPFGGGLVTDNGACCLPTGTCLSRSPECCAQVGGTFLGFGIDCTPGFCFGACCHGAGYCTGEPSAGACLSSGGVYQGVSTSCANVDCPINNETCTTAAMLSIDDTVFVNTTNAITDVVPSGNCGTSALNKGVWFSVIGNGQTITISTCNPGTTFDTMVQVFCECGNFVCVGGNDDSSCFVGAGNLSSLFSFCSAIGQTYIIQLGGFGATFGVAELSISSNGVFCGLPPTCVPQIRRCCFADGFAGACLDLTAGDCAAQPFGQWGTAGQTCGTLCPIGRCCYVQAGVPACLVSNQAECNSRGGTWTALQNCQPGDCNPPPNDTCATAQFVPCNTLFAGTNVGASDDYAFTAEGCSGFASLGPDVVYAFNSPSSQILTIVMDPADSDLGLYVVTDCSNPQASCVVADDSGDVGAVESVTLNATAGVTYYILVETYGNSGNPGDDFTLEVVCESCSGCMGDLHVDNLLNARDIQGFVDCCVGFGPSCGCADIDENGVMNVNDIVVFVNAVLSKTTCPP